MFSRVIITFKNSLALQAVALSMLFSLLYNSPYYWIVLEGDYVKVFKSCISGAFELFILWYILLLNRYVFLIFGLPTFLLAASFSYYVFKYKVLISVGLIRVITLADPREVSGFFESGVVLWSVISILIFALFFVLRYQLKSIKTLKHNLIIIVIFTFCALIGKAVEPKAIKRHISMPYVFYEHGYHYWLEANRINKFLNNKLDISEKYTFSADLPEKLTVVLVIGESARGDHFQINGYEKPTTPKFASYDMLSFKRALSCKTLTSHSMTCMFTGSGLTNWEESLKRTTFISVFNKLGFKTYWISNQGRLGHDTWVGSIASESKSIYFCDDNMTVGANTFDTCMIPEYSKILDEDIPYKLIIVHMFGSHARYDERYTKEYEFFTPVCDKTKQFSNCVGEELINIYDNSIRASDEFLGELVDLLKDKEAMFIYASDHAEPLGENGNRARGDDKSIYQRHIPFVFWLSDKRKFNSHYYDIIKSNLIKPIGHDNLIHSILDCSGIKSDFIDNSSSVCSYEYAGYTDPLINWD